MTGDSTLILLVSHSPSMLITAGTDFTTTTSSVTVLAQDIGDIRTIDLPEFFNVIDDDINEIEQSFAIVVEIGPDVPTNTACFQLNLGEGECLGRRGATDIRIIDNDRKLYKSRYY